MLINGILYVVLTLLIWGVTFANTRALLFDFSALEILVIRYVLAWVSLLVFGIIGREHILKWYGRNEILFALMGLTGVLVYQFLENCAIYYTNASNVAIIVSFGPIVTALLMRVFTKDKCLSAFVVIGSLVAVIGVSLVSLNGILNFNLCPLGDIMAIVAMISWGMYSVLIDRTNKHGIPPLIAIRKAFFWAIVFMIPLVVWGMTESGFYALDGSFSINLDWSDNIVRFGQALNLFNLGFLGVLASALSFVLWSKACSRLGTVRTTVCLYLVPIVGVVFASLCLDEQLTVMNLLGGAIIIFGVILANWRNKNDKE